MLYIIPLVGIAGILLTLIVYRVVGMWLNHEISAGELFVLTGLLGWLIIYSWAKWPSLPSLFLMGSVGLAYGGLRVGERRLRIKTAEEPLKRAEHLTTRLKAAIRERPDNAHLRVTLGDMYSDLGRMGEALGQYAAAALLEPKSYEIDRKRQKAESRRLRMVTEGMVFCAVCGSPNPKRRRFCHRCTRALPQVNGALLAQEGLRKPVRPSKDGAAGAFARGEGLVWTEGRMDGSEEATTSASGAVPPSLP